MNLKQLFVTNCLLLALCPLWAQNRAVRGVVTDGAFSQPMPGAAIIQKGTTNGVVTDQDGAYAITVSEGSTLEFSCIGYKTLSIAATQDVINVTLEEDREMIEETVVVGYGVQRKSSLTGAVSSVKNDDLQHRSATSISSALAGKTSGLRAYSSSARPGAMPSIQVRGISSNGSSAPLYVIDGRVTTDPGSLDPENIESIEILKDGASAAIYGASAGNGVILVTTKKGKGEGTVTFDAQWVSQRVGYIPEVASPQEWVDYYIASGRVTLDSVYSNWDGQSKTDWAKVALEPSFMQKYTLKFQGGNERGSFYVSGGYLDNNGMVVGDADVYKRFTGVINASYKIKSWLEIGTNNNLEYGITRSIDEGSSVNNLFTSILSLDPITPVYTTEDKFNDKMKKAFADPLKYGPLLKAADGRYYGVSPFTICEATNPLIVRDKNLNQSRSLSFAGTTYANIYPVKGLTLTSRISYSFNNGESRNVGRPYFSDYPTAASQFYSITEMRSTMNYWQWENFANYLNSWKGHTFSAMIGTSYSEAYSKSLSGSIKGSLDGVTTSLKDLGIMRDDPHYWYLDYATPESQKQLGGGVPGYTRKLAFYGRVGYDYKGRYLIQASLRADAADTSILPLDNRWGFFPSVSAGWVLSNERWMQSAKHWLSFLKIRGSWGQNGSLASLGGHAYAMNITKTGLYNFGNDLNYSYGYAPSSTGNNHLKWETSEQADLGLDIRMFSDRFSISADYFHKMTKDLIISGATLSNIAGFPASPINAGSLVNQGLDLEVGWKDVRGDFSYDIRANYSYLNNEVTKVYDTVDRLEGARPRNITKPQTIFEKGKPAWYLYGYKFTGIDPLTGDPTFEDISNDGQLGTDDQTMLGSGIPKHSFGITINLAWKGIDLLVFGSGAAGVDIFNMYATGESSIASNLRDFWTPDNPLGTRPRPKSTLLEKYYDSDVFIFDGSYFKIKQIQLGYSFPTKLMEKIHFKAARLYVSLEDFFTFTKYPGYDPEVTGFGNAIGIDTGLYPNARKLMFGLSLTF